MRMRRTHDDGLMGLELFVNLMFFNDFCLFAHLLAKYRNKANWKIYVNLSNCYLFIQFF